MSKNEIIENGIKLDNKYNYIICPECKENARILINNYKFCIYGCKNGHNKNDILIKDFKATQIIDEPKIKCHNCESIKQNSLDNKDIYLCLKCNKNLCESCKIIHDKTHNIINHKDKYFICDFHFEPYNSYCLTCKKDICMQCKFEHKEHKILFYEELISNTPNGKDEINIFFDRKECLKKDINNIINIFQDLIKSIDNCYDIIESFIDRYKNGNNLQNYFLLQNINELNKYKDNFISDMNEIIDEKNIFNKANCMIDLHNKMSLSNNIYFKKETFNDIKYNINNDLDIQNSKDEIENSIIIKDRNSNDSFINKKMEFNSDYFLISEENEDNNYTNFDISKIKKLLTLKNDKLIFNKIYVLKDGRIIAHNNEHKDKNIFLCFIFDLKNDKCFNININKIYEILQMADGIILIATESELKLIDIKNRNFEIIQALKTESFRMYKLSDEKILTITSKNSGNLFIYKNKNLVFEKQINLKSIKNNFLIHEICSINENEVAIYYGEFGFFGAKRYLGFFDLEKDKKLKTFDIDIFNTFSFDLMNNKLLIAGNNRKIFPIDLINHSKKKEFTLPKQSNIHSIISLNAKQFIVGQYDYINQFELDKDYKFNLINTIDLKCSCIYKYPKSRLLIKEIGNNIKSLILYG